jgi:hypothetical protein
VKSLRRVCAVCGRRERTTQRLRALKGLLLLPAVFTRRLHSFTLTGPRIAAARRSS